MAIRWALAGALYLGFLLNAPRADEAKPGDPSPAPPAATGGEPAPGVAMNNHYLETTLRSLTDELDGGDGQWLLTWFDVEMLVISDEGADRMRAIALIDSAADLNSEQMRFLLEINFERALDAKYTIWQEQVWATYVHPLSWLTPEELKAGMLQVVSLYRTYGTEFTSTGTTFEPPAVEEDED